MLIYEFLGVRITQHLLLIVDAETCIVCADINAKTSFTGIRPPNEIHLQVDTEAGRSDCMEE